MSSLPDQPQPVERQVGVHVLDRVLWFMGNPRPVSVSGAVYHEFAEFMRASTGAEVDVEVRGRRTTLRF